MAGKWIFNRKMKSPYRMHIRYVDILQELKVVVVNVFSGQREVYRKTSMKRLLAFHPETSVPGWKAADSDERHAYCLQLLQKIAEVVTKPFFFPCPGRVDIILCRGPRSVLLVPLLCGNFA
ncbi:MAG: hypothetical protein DRH04_05435 [Deltaproteobacteria bacterium]|nr:MAG: hypothetical protein DRH04_05435 [Deltaproteobacteria bacterium]